MNNFVTALLHPEVQHYLQENALADPVEIALKNIAIQHIRSAELANHCGVYIDSMRKLYLRNKLMIARDMQG